MIEVETKLKINNKERIAEKILSMGFKLKTSVREEDRYYDNDYNDIRKSDCALRIRTITDMDNGTATNQINYKGKRLDEITMTRPEYETEVVSLENMDKILGALGYKAVEPFVIKYRKEYELNDVNICIDQVDGLGDFLEVEKIVGDSREKDEALNNIEEILNALGFNIEETTNKSYLSQLMEKEE